MIETQTRVGKVWLIGAGPGAADLLTLRAARVLAQADAIFCDALVCEDVLALAPRARVHYVGKRAGRPSPSQQTINSLLVRAARRGHKVVRLKCGDPFVFGRGGEELLALARAGIPVEAVPGVSSAVAGPGAAAIPITHRGAASGALILTGEPEDTWRHVLGVLPPGLVTVVMLMALRKRAELSATLVGKGWPAATPVAIVVDATQPTQRQVFTTLGDLAHVQLPASVPGATGAGVIVIGDVVSVGHEIAALASSATSALAGVA